MNRDAKETVLVVVQGDAACPMWMTHWGPAPVEDWAMLEQEVHETHAEFTERLGQAAVRFSADVVNPVVLFVASSDADSLTWDAATTVLTQLAQRGGGGKFLFTRGFGPERRVDASLVELAEEIAEEWAWAGIEIGVRRHEQKVPQLRRASAPPFPSYQPENRAVAHAV